MAMGAKDGMPHVATCNIALVVVTGITMSTELGTAGCKSWHGTEYDGKVLSIVAGTVMSANLSMALVIVSGMVLGTNYVTVLGTGYGMVLGNVSGIAISANHGITLGVSMALDTNHGMILLDTAMSRPHFPPPHSSPQY
eukprot:8257607-Ditylum_brightwellii.AAC.1